MTDPEPTTYKALVAVDSVKDLVAELHAAKARVTALKTELRGVRTAIRDGLRKKPARSITKPSNATKTPTVKRRGLPTKPGPLEDPKTGA
jgi:hypothetical protein